MLKVKGAYALYKVNQPVEKKLKKKKKRTDSPILGSTKEIVIFRDIMGAPLVGHWQIVASTIYCIDI